MRWWEWSNTVQYCTLVLFFPNRKTMQVKIYEDFEAFFSTLDCRNVQQKHLTRQSWKSEDSAVPWGVGLDLYLGLNVLWCKSCLNSSTAACTMSLIVMASKCQHVHHHRRGLCKSAGTIDLLLINWRIFTLNIKNKRHSRKKGKKNSCTSVIDVTFFLLPSFTDTHLEVSYILPFECII